MSITEKLINNIKRNYDGTISRTIEIINTAGDIAEVKVYPYFGGRKFVVEISKSDQDGRLLKEDSVLAEEYETFDELIAMGRELLENVLSEFI